jgi:REP element-mobilizing transposase RayT
MTDRHNPDQHHRQSIRLRGWDYTTPGGYFITICTHRRENLFENPRLRAVVEYAWQNIPCQPHAGHVALDEWVVMPNHLHGILVLEEIDDSLGRGEAGRTDDEFATGSSLRPAPPLRRDPIGLKPGSVGAIVGNFKSLTTRQVNNLQRTPGAKVWQRGYYDRIVRNERELDAIRQYIRDNPARWTDDRENLDGLLSKMDGVGTG